MRIQLNRFSYDDCDKTFTLSYHHHEIRSMTHLPLIRVRSWNKGMRCIYFFIFLRLRLGYALVRIIWQIYPCMPRGHELWLYAITFICWLGGHRSRGSNSWHACGLIRKFSKHLKLLDVWVWVMQPNGLFCQMNIMQIYFKPLQNLKGPLYFYLS